MMALTTIPQIETALNQIETKKTALKTAFQNLQSHSSSLSSFPLTWPELETHFSTLQSNLLSSFSSLKSQKTQQPDDPLTHPPARPELITLCQNMDGVGLRNYLTNHPKDVANIRTEMADVFARAADPGLMVLDSLNGFCHGEVFKESRFRTACVLLLEEFCKVRERVSVGEEVREKAKRIAEEWRERIEGGKEGEGGMERLGYLHLVAAFGLREEWGDREVNEVVDCVVSVARYRQSVDLCQSLGIRDRIPDVIQRLIMKGKQLIALRFVFAFGLSDQFPPVPLLKTYLADARKVAQTVRKSGKNSRQALNEAAVKEINAFKAVIKCVKDHGLESDYPVQDLILRADKLEKEQAERKKSAPPTLSASAPVPKSQQKSNPQQSKQNGRKRKAGGAPSGDRRKQPTYSLQPSFTNRAGLVTQEHAAPYLMNQPGGPYAGSSHAVGPYVMGASANPNVYGLAGAPPGYTQNQINPAAAASNHSYHHPSAATHAQPGHHYDNGSTVVGGYAATGYDVVASSQYHPHPVYYPQ